MRTDVLSIWTVYDHPSDHPDIFVARRWIVGEGGHRPTMETIGSTDLERLRDELEARGLVCLPREPGDDPKIIENWI